ncbi:hypothetical protein [Terrarubrum flagellatum]|uniref:hypothetical protein n=1 Tax=Terrirubrum flagellatum TaxID=2895980 RepID=UPI00314524B7
MLDEEARNDVTRARQGVTGHNVWKVLALGVIGAAIVFLIAYLFYFSGAPNPSAVS